MFTAPRPEYLKFRAKIKVWLPNLLTLDGTDFTEEANEIIKIRTQVESEKPKLISQFSSGVVSAPTVLASIPEESKSQNLRTGADEDVFEKLKAKNATVKHESTTSGKSTY